MTDRDRLQRLEEALRYVWNAWSDAEGSGQPEGAVFGPEPELREYIELQGTVPREAPPAVQAIIREVIGIKEPAKS